MRSARQNPDSDQNQRDTRQAQRETFALQMAEALRLRTAECHRRGECVHCGMLLSQCDCWDGKCVHCGMLLSQCDCWDPVNGQGD